MIIIMSVLYYTSPSKLIIYNMLIIVGCKYTTVVVASMYHTIIAAIINATYVTRPAIIGHVGT